MSEVAEKAQESADPSFVRDVLEGLSRPQKAIPSRWLYDLRGSALFEEITRLPEYYPTRTEIAVLEACAPEIARDVGPGATIIEYGSGSSRKTRLLLDALEAPAAYVPVDISGDFLEGAAAELDARYPDMAVRPVTADFMTAFELPADLPQDPPRLGFFPGSTIGNLGEDEARRFLRQVARHVGAGGHLVIGADLTRDPAVLIPAYDDAAGVTAAFDRNLLVRMNRELGADFDPASFRHEARWNEAESRVEMHLVSTGAQTVRLLGRGFDFAAGESIHTENSRKYDVQRFVDMVRGAGWDDVRHWTDASGRFAVFHMRHRQG